MKKQFDFTYGDENVDKKTIFMIVPSMIIAIDILKLPRTLASIVPFSDGWISIVLAGLIMSAFLGITCKLTSLFPGETFFDYTKKIATKPIAILLTLIFSVHFAYYVCFESRSIATISKQYIFDRTPVEVISLIFFFLVAYAVAGSRAAIVRLNLMFFPIVIFGLLLVLLFNINFIKISELKPVFQANWVDILKGAHQASFSFVGFEVLLFYMSLLHKEEVKKITKYPIISLLTITMLYVLVFLVVIAVLSIEGTLQVLYPTVELAKEVEIPGGIIERIDPLFFTIYIMTIFNTAAMSLDIMVMAIQSVFKKLKKKIIIFTSLPILYLFSMLPQDHIQMDQMGFILGYSGLVLSTVIPTFLLVLAIMRGVQES